MQQKEISAGRRQVSRVRRRTWPCTRSPRCLEGRTSSRSRLKLWQCIMMTLLSVKYRKVVYCCTRPYWNELRLGTWWWPPIRGSVLFEQLPRSTVLFGRFWSDFLKKMLDIHIDEAGEKNWGPNIILTPQLLWFLRVVALFQNWFFFQNWGPASLLKPLAIAAAADDDD